MSKELFEAYREDEMMAIVNIPYMRYKDLKDQWEYEEHLNLVKVYHPEHNKQYKLDKRWNDLNETVKECREEMKEIESEIRVDGTIIS